MEAQGSETNLTWENVQEISSERLVFVLNGKVYSLDDNEFAHPGGSDVLAEYSGTDITDVFHGRADDPTRHAHSAAAIHLLETFCIGTLASSAATTTTAADQPCSDHSTTTTTPAAIDESKPLLWQVGSLGESYMSWVEAPMPGHPRFFKNDFAEACTKTPWWVVPLLWIPVILYSLQYGASTLPDSTSFIVLVALGVILWQGLEYSLHRFVFHLHPTSPTGIFLHFLVHGCHHKYPMDIERLVFPPLPASWIVTLVFSLIHSVAPTKAVAMTVFGGVMVGYVAYDCMHYWMHSGVLRGPLKVAHMRHHYVDSQRAYGISSPLFDALSGTMAVKGAVKGF